LYVSETVFVIDTAQTVVHGALVRFKVSTGTATPSQASSNAGGLASTSWALTPQQGHTETLSACASNSASRCEHYVTVLTVNV